MEIKGTIQKIEQSAGVGKTGTPWTRWAYTINDKKYSTFDKKIGEKFKVGEHIVIVGIQGEQYFDMTEMRYAKDMEVQQMDADVPVEKPYDKAISNPEGRPKEFHLSIEEVRCRALEVASKGIMGLANDGEKFNIFQHAEQLEQWILRTS